MSVEKKLFCFRLTLTAEGGDADDAFMELLGALQKSGAATVYARCIEEIEWRSIELQEIKPTFPNEPIEHDDEDIEELVAMIDWSGASTETKA